jgi:hypothetical protein
MDWQTLAVQLKFLQIQISQVGGEYHAVALDVGTEHGNLLSIYGKNENRELQSNTSNRKLL